MRAQEGRRGAIMDEYALNEDHFKLVIICDGFKVILYLPLENLE